MATVWLSKDQHAEVMFKRIQKTMWSEKSKLKMSQATLGDN